MNYEEYKEKIKNHFLKYWSSLSDAEVDEYLKSEDSLIRERYSYYLDDDSSCNGEGDYASVAYCLQLMY